MERVKLGMVGLNFGSKIIQRLQKGPGSQYVEVVAVCDVNKERADKAAADFGLKAYDHLDEMLQDPEIRAVGLFTGPVGRAELIRKIIQHGKDVLTTKPFELNPDATLAVFEEAQRLGRIIHLNSPSPVYSPDLLKIQEWVEKYQLGRVISCRCDSWSSYREKPDGSWYDDPERCPAAPIFRIGIYLINDLVRLIGPAAQVNLLQSRIFTERPTVDNAQLGIVFKNGAIGNVYASFCTKDGDYYKDSLVLNFENGSIYRNCGPGIKLNSETMTARLELKTYRDGEHIMDEAVVEEHSGEYQWDVFCRAVNGEAIPGQVLPEQIAEGIRVIAAMSKAIKNGGVATV